MGRRAQITLETERVTEAGSRSAINLISQFQESAKCAKSVGSAQKSVRIVKHAQIVKSETARKA